MRIPRLASSVALVAMLAGTAVHAQPSDAPLRPELDREEGRLIVSYDVTTALTESFRRRFLGGITSRVRIRTLFIDLDGDEIGRFERRCEMRFDVWDEVAFLRLTDDGDDRRLAYRLVDRALQACGELDRVGMVPIEVLPTDGFRILSEVALNPVSEELLEKTREFMSNPSGTSGGRPSFFGAIARLFRSNRSAQGESFLFRSPPLEVPEPP